MMTKKELGLIWRALETSIAVQEAELTTMKSETFRSMVAEHIAELKAVQIEVTKQYSEME